MSTVQEFKTQEAVASHLASLPASTVAVLTFHAPWAKPCARMRTLLDTIAATLPAADPPRASFLWVDAEALPDLAEEHDVRSVPCMVLLRAEQPLDKVYGCSADTVKPAIDKALAARDKDESGQNGSSSSLPPRLEVNPRPLAPGAGAPIAPIPPLASFANGAAGAAAANSAAAPPVEPAKNLASYAPGASDPATAPQMSSSAMANGGGEEALNERLAGLVKAAPVMLFMKGTPSAPQCGFSRQLVSVLREQGVKYGFFNILADEDIRQGLKKWADWPTYPQLWMDGELIGGLDIVSDSCRPLDNTNERAGRWLTHVLWRIGQGGDGGQSRLFQAILGRQGPRRDGGTRGAKATRGCSEWIGVHAPGQTHSIRVL